MIGAGSKLLLCCAVAERWRQGVVAGPVDVRVDVLIGVCCVACGCGGVVVWRLGWVGLVFVKCGVALLVGWCVAGSWWVVVRRGGPWRVVVRGWS